MDAVALVGSMKKAALLHVVSAFSAGSCKLPLSFDMMHVIMSESQWVKCFDFN